MNATNTAFKVVKFFKIFAFFPACRSYRFSDCGQVCSAFSGMFEPTFSEARRVWTPTRPTRSLLVGLFRVILSGKRTKTSTNSFPLVTGRNNNRDKRVSHQYILAPDWSSFFRPAGSEPAGWCERFRQNSNVFQRIVLARLAMLHGAPTRRASVIFCARDFLSPHFAGSCPCLAHPYADDIIFTPHNFNKVEIVYQVVVRQKRWSQKNIKKKSGDFFLKKLEKVKNRSNQLMQTL